VRIPAASACCGLTWITTGQLDGARRQLARTLAATQDAVAAGIPVVGLEPSCTAVLRADLVELLPEDPRARALQAATRTLAELLAERQWAPPSLRGMQVLVQPHCHHHAVLGFGPDHALLDAAGAQRRTVGGCCGLAGNFGVEQGHYEVSVAVAELSLLPAVRASDPSHVVLADGFSCRTQLEQLSDRRGIHLAELLASKLAGSDRAAGRVDPVTGSCS
jgi:Fe-S oxidoreductase